MGHVIGTMGVVFGLGGSFFAPIGVAMGIALVRRLLNRREALAHGLLAEARCLDTYTTRSDDGPTQRHMILGFRTHDGQDIRIDETSPGTVVVGDFVPVR